MPSVTGLGITSGLLARARRRWRGARSSAAFLQAGGLRNERGRFFALRRLFHRVRRDGGRAGSFCCVGDLAGGAMKSGFFFRSEGMWLTWASCLTVAHTGDYALAKRWYGGFSMLRRLLRSNPHRYRARIFRSDECHQVDAWICRADRRSGKGRSQEPARIETWLWRVLVRPAAMLAGVLLDLRTLATSRELIEVCRGLFQHRETILRDCLPWRDPSRAKHDAQGGMP